MKKYEYYFGTICVILALLPLVLLSNMGIVYKHFNEILEALGGLMSLAILLVIFDVIDDRCLSISTAWPGTKERKDFFTVPIMFVIFLSELILLYLINPTYIEEHFTTLIALIGSMVFAFVLYAIFGGNHRIIRTVEEEVDEEKVEEEVEKK